MDRDKFDAFTRLFASRRSRRGALATLLSGTILANRPAAMLADRNGKHRGRGKGKAVHAQQAPAGCFTGSPCIPGSGAYLANCDFEDSNSLENVNCKGCNLSRANLQDADASGVNLTKANLQKACLVDADLTGATIAASTNLLDAIFCRTIMPNGSTNNSGCSKGTRCCRTCIEIGESCGAGVGGACCGAGAGIACRGTIKAECQTEFPGNRCCALEGSLCGDTCDCCDDLVCTIGGDGQLRCQASEP